MAINNITNVTLPDVGKVLFEGNTYYVIGTQTAATNVWTGNLPEGVDNYYDGLSIEYYLPVAGNSSNATLNLSGKGAKPVYRQGGGGTTTHYPAKSIIHMTYVINSGLNSGNGCFLCTGYYDSNSDTYDRDRVNANIKSGSTAIVAGNIIVADSNSLYHHLKDGTAFSISNPILYAGSAISANSTGTNNYTFINFTVTTTQSITLTAYLPVYIKGTLSGTTFTPVSTTPLTQTVPTSDDGYYYIRLGVATSTTAVYLLEDHPIYAYKNGKLGEIVNSALNVNGYTVEKNVPSNAVFTDTKNTAGATDTSSKIFLVGATAQTANPQTYSDDQVYTTSGTLTTNKVQVGVGQATMEYNSTLKSIDFVFT